MEEKLLGTESTASCTRTAEIKKKKVRVKVDEGAVAGHVGVSCHTTSRPTNTAEGG